MKRTETRGLLWQRAKSDWGIVLITMTLVVIGLVMILSTSRELPYINPALRVAPMSYFDSQLIYALMGFAAMAVISRIDYRYYRRFVIPIGLVTVLMLGVMVALQGRFLSVRESEGNTFGRGQITEVAKYGVIVYLAAWLASAGKRLQNLRTGMLPVSCLVGIACGAVAAQHDLSTAVLLGAVCVAMLFVAGANMLQLSALVVIGVGVCVALIFATDYQHVRLLGWLADPMTEFTGRGMQPVRSRVALNNGGLFGLGLGRGIENRNLHSMAHTDYMFAMIGEQVGFLGGLVVLALLAAWTWRGLRVAQHAGDSFGRLVAVGFVSWEALRTIMHLAVVTTLMPVTGTVLPFVSYGGSALVAGLAAVGVLLNISRRATLDVEALQ